jgi:hypothetical protein
MQGEERARELNDEEVHNDNDDPDNEEGWVVEEASADVLLVMDLPCGDHVDDLEPNEEVEDEGHVTARVSTYVRVLGAFYLRVITVNQICVVNLFIKLIAVEFVASTGEYVFTVIDADCFTVYTVVTEHLIGLRDHVFTTEEEDEKNDHLIERHPDDVLGHLARDNEVLLDLGRALEEVRLGKLSRESQRGQRIHDHVDPEELNGLQR